jgi:hypothetical protein
LGAAFEERLRGSDTSLAVVRVEADSVKCRRNHGDRDEAAHDPGGSLVHFPLSCGFPFDAHAQAKMQVPVMTTTHNQSRPVRETAAGTAILAFSSAAVSGSSSENPL